MLCLRHRRALLTQAAALTRAGASELIREYCWRFRAVTDATQYIRRITDYMHRWWIPQQMSDIDDADARDTADVVCELDTVRPCPHVIATGLGRRHAQGLRPPPRLGPREWEAACWTPLPACLMRGHMRRAGR